MAKGDKLIAKGMKTLTSAVADLEKGVALKEAAITDNAKKVVKLQIETEKKVVELETESAVFEDQVAKTNTIIGNFRKNILGE